MTRKLAISLLALIACAGLLATACNSRGGDDQASDAGSGDSRVAIADRTAPGSDDVGSSAGGSGSDGSASTGDASTTSRPRESGSAEVLYVEAAAARTAELESYQFAMQFGMEGLPDMSGPLTFSAEGGVDAVNQRLHMRMDMNSLFDVVPAGTSDEELAMMRALMGDGIIEFISDSGTTYVSWSLFTNLFGADTKWVSFTDDSSDALSGFSGGLGLEQLGMGPDALLESFGGIGSIEEAGPDVVRGVETTRYIGRIDLAQAVELADAADAADLEQQLDALGVDELGSLPVEIWIDGDGFLRRFLMDFDLAELAGGAAAAGLGPARMSINAEFFNFGDAVQIPLPSPDEVTELDGSDLFGGGG